MFKDIFGNILQEKNITPYRVAKEAGISQGLMGSYTRGEKNPTTTTNIK